jgi:hypothetical protein
MASEARKRAVALFAYPGFLNLPRWPTRIAGLDKQQRRERKRRNVMLNIDARNPDAITIFNVLSTSDTEAFLRDLSDLSRRHGIAITGSPTLFVMERDDHQYDYRANDDSVLSFG